MCTEQLSLILKLMSKGLFIFEFYLKETSFRWTVFDCFSYNGIDLKKLKIYLG
jgi:hypothetical protein